ncbi:MAG: SPOR domain-containing protein [Gemmatimonadales bacterium]|nr:SPOR domain-containing protein [Gemmatimonadales bacterium]
MATRRLTLLGVLALILAVGLTPTATSAQTNPQLIAAVQLAQDGHADSARAAVRALLDRTDPVDNLYAEALYTSGIVAATEFDRRIALRRVIVEYSTSEWADDALLLLAQVEYASGNPGASVSQVSRLLADYPSSPLRAMAAFWGARAAGDLRNGVEACRLADIGLTARPDDIELRNQLEFQKQRCGSIQAQGVDPAAPVETTTVSPTAPAPAPARPPTAAPARGGFRVQVIAAPNQAAANQQVTRLKGLGYESTVVHEGGFFKVRAGPFATRALANQALARIRSQLGGQPFIVADP